MILKWIYTSVAIALISCGGMLTREERAQAKKAIEDGQIKRVTPVQLTETTIAYGAKLADQIQHQDLYMRDSSFVDSLSRANNVTIYVLREGVPGISTKESEILEAYLSEKDLGVVPDNVQTLDETTLLFTRAVTSERPDGSRPFSHAIAIRISVKTIVNSIKQ